VISETFAEMRRALLASLDRAEQELEEQTRHGQLQGTARVRRLLTDSRDCAQELDAELRELVQHLEDVRANVEEIRERLTTCLRELDEPSADKPDVEADLEPEAELEPEAQLPPPPSSEDTVRLLRAALETLSQQRNGGSRH
jgi:plasmid stabilization system protein ParE